MTAGGRFMVACLLALLALATAGAVWIWNAGDGSSTISGHGLVALALGVVGSLVVGGGLMALAFFSNRSGHDQAVHDEHRRAEDQLGDDQRH